MAKSKKTTKKTIIPFFKNPLAQAFGLVLKKQRMALGKSSDEIIDDIHIGASYYRLVETGANYLHISKAIALVKAFQGKLHFEAVCKILLSISTMEVAAKQMENAAVSNQLQFDYAYTLNEAARELANFDEKLKLLFAKFFEFDIFSRTRTESANQVADIIETTPEVMDTMNNFLLRYPEFGKKPAEIQTKNGLEFLQDIPTIYFDIMSELKKGLMSLPMNIQFANLWDWEEKNSMQFERLDVIISDSRLIASADNLNMYTYPYLWNDKFSKARFLYLDDRPAAEIYQDFKKYLKHSIADKNDLKKLENFDYKLNKVEFKHCLTQNLPAGFFEARDFENPTQIRTHNALWVFSFLNGNIVGYIADMQPENKRKFGGISLNYQLTYQKLNLFEELWNKSK